MAKAKMVAVEPDHSLAGILAMKLSGIEVVAPKEQRCMVRNAVRAGTEWARRCEKKKEQLQAENKKLRELMKGATLDYGYANSWPGEPLLVKECKQKGHERKERRMPGAYPHDHIVWCDQCHYRYKYDSS